MSYLVGLAEAISAQGCPALQIVCAARLPVVATPEAREPLSIGQLQT